MYHCKKSHFFLSLFSVLEFALRAWHIQASKSSVTELQPSPRLFLNGLLSCSLHCQAGWKEADVLQREFPSVRPQGTLTAVTLICQDTCPWRGSHLLCDSHCKLHAVLDILFCLIILVIEIIKWEGFKKSIEGKEYLLGLPLLELG